MQEAEQKIIYNMLGGEVFFNVNATYEELQNCIVQLIDRVAELEAQIPAVRIDLEAGAPMTAEQIEMEEIRNRGRRSKAQLAKIKSLAMEAIKQNPGIRMTGLKKAIGLDGCKWATVCLYNMLRLEPTVLKAGQKRSSAYSIA